MGIRFTILGLIVSGLLLSCSPREYSFELYTHYVGRSKDLVRASFQKFMKKHPNIRIQAIYRDFPEIEKMMNRSGDTASTKFRDAFIIPHDRIGQLAAAGLIQEIDGYIRSKRGLFLPNMLNAVRYRGKYYAFPLSGECVSLYYNTRLLDKPPAAMKDLLALRARFLDPAADRHLLLLPLHIPYYTLP